MQLLFVLGFRNKLVETEVNFHVELYRHRLTIFLSRIELPLADGFNGLLIQAHAQRSRYTHIPRMAIRTDNKPDHAYALILSLAGLFRIFRIGLVKNPWCGYAAADIKDATPESAA